MRDQIVSNIFIILTLQYQPGFFKDSLYYKNTTQSLPLKLWLCLSYPKYLQDFLKLCHSQISNSTSNHNILNLQCYLTHNIYPNHFLICTYLSKPNNHIKIPHSYLNKHNYNNHYNNLSNHFSPQQCLQCNNKIKYLPKSILINKRNLEK